MTDYVIPCDTLARLSKVAEERSATDVNEWFKTLRIDNGVAVATNSKFMAVERINGPAGIIHILLDPALVAQCEAEAAYHSTLTITAIPEMQLATAKTTLGYVYPGNCVMWSSDSPRTFDNWREIIDRVREPAAVPNGGMAWGAVGVARLAASSPSKRVVFEEVIDVSRPVIIRDTHDDNWFGIFQPWLQDQELQPAMLPGWFR